MSDTRTPEQQHKAELEETSSALIKQRTLSENAQAELATAEAIGNREAAEAAADLLNSIRHELNDLENDLSEIVAIPPAQWPIEHEQDIDPGRRRAIAPADGLAVVIGHTRTAPGAKGNTPPFPTATADGRNEYFWNTELARWIEEEAQRRQIPCKIFERRRPGSQAIRDAYARAKVWGPKATVELHFNNGGGNARGTETLYEKSTSMRWAQALQDQMLIALEFKGQTFERNGRARSFDRKLKLASANGRGVTSLVQISPSALIEPFFADNTDDATVGINRKRQLAISIVDAFAAFTGIQTSSNEQPATATPTAATTTITAAAQQAAASLSPRTDLPGMNPLWVRLRDTYAAAAIEFPILKGITMAQWTLESGWAKSPLAIEHLNFGGLKYRDFLADICTKVRYKGDDYCKFDSIEKFFQGYWRRFDAISAYDGWRGHTDGPFDYIRFIADVYAPPRENKNYLDQISDIYARLDKAGQLPVEPPAPATAAAPQTTPASQPTATTSPGTSATVAAAAAAAAAATPVVSTPATTTSPTTPAATAAPQPQSPAQAPAQATPQTTATSPPPSHKKIAQLLRDANREATPGFVEACDILDESGGRERDVVLAMVAHWGAESQWGHSDLAKWHFNLAGIEWTELLSDFAAPARHPTKNEQHCRFLSHGQFVRGYLYRRAADPGFANSPAVAKTADEYLETIAPVWRPNAPGYKGNVMKVVNDLRRADVQTIIAAPETTAPTNLPTTNQPGQNDEFVIQVMRTHTERRGRKTRTVGTYQVTLNGQKLPGLEGHMIDPHGPSDNGPSGRANARRIEPGRYPLWTHYGSKRSQGKIKYKTHHHTTSPAQWKPSIVSIALRDTGYRAGVLIHPATGLHSSAGCLHPSKPLRDETQNVDWADSRNRVLSIKQALEDHISGFPDENAKRIPNAWIEIREDPGLARRRSLLASRTRRVDGGVDISTDITDAVIEGLAGPELFRLLSDTIDGGTLPGVVGLALFKRILHVRAYTSPVFWLWRAFTVAKQLNELRGTDNENLWQAWVNGWSAAERIADPAQREQALAHLLKVAEILKDRGVNVNDRGGLLTALTFAARGDAVGAIIKLVEFGADINLTDSLGNAPLVWAAFEGASNAAGALIRLGANIDISSAKEYKVDNILTRQPRSIGGPPQADVEVTGLVDEAPPPDADPVACAKAGRELANDNPQRTRDFDTIIAALRKGT